MKTAIVRFDKRITGAVQSMPVQSRPFMYGITLCGSTFAILAVLALTYLYSDSSKQAIILIVIAILLDLGLKQYLHRPRPDTLYVSHMRFKTHSFPSGHAFGSITTYGFLSYLALNNLSMPLGLVIAVLIWLLTILIGVSRVYLGAHYPTDVLGGWVLGAICLYAALVLL
jgi:undecaprenyl-diphosphatase